MSLDPQEFRQYLAIDKSSLDDAVQQQSSLLFEISEAFARAVAERDLLKEKLAITDAELDSEMRGKMEKATEAAVKSKIQVDKRHKAAFESYIKAKERADVLDALKQAFVQRGYMVRELCNLFVANYFEASSVRGTSNTDTVHYRQRREALAEKRTRK